MRKKKRNNNRNRRKLRILYVCGMFPSILHAGGLRIFDILQSLVKKHEVDIYSMYDPNLDDDSLKIIEKEFAFCSMRLLRAGLWSKQEIAQDLVLWLRDKKKFYDVVQIEYHSMVYLADYLRPFCKKVFFTIHESLIRRDYIELIHGLNTDASESVLASRLFNLIVSAKLEKLALSKCDVFLTVTQTDKDFALKIKKDSKIYVLPTCISDYVFFSKARKQNADCVQHNLVTFLGYFGHHPNHDAMKWYLTLIHPKIREAVPGYKFQIIGSGDITPLRKLVQNDPSVVLTGQVDDIASYLAKTHVCVAPLITGSGIRGKINQYSALKKPTVTTSIGINGMPYRHLQSILVADDPQEFAKCVINLLQDEKLYEKIAESAYQLVLKHYSWPKQIKNLEKLYYG